MPSFKTCLASIAVLAFTFAPVVVASPTSPVQALEHLSRRLVGDAAVASPNVARSRVESRKEAVARVFAAKRRAAAKAKRTIGATSPVVASTLEARAVVAKKKATKAPTAAAIIAFSAYTTTRCGQPKTCINSPNVDAFTGANQVYSCNKVTRRCVVTCDAGFLGPDAGGQCTASAVTCPTPPANGIYTLSGSNCVLSCDASLGYIAASSGGTLQCVNPTTDPKNCGSVGTVCPASYNGVGTATCFQGNCSLRCGGGTFKRTTLTGKSFCA